MSDHSSPENAGLMGAAMEALADRILDSKATWLPLTGHVRNITFTLNEADLIADVLREAGIRAQPAAAPANASALAERLFTAACRDDLPQNVRFDMKLAAEAIRIRAQQMREPSFRSQVFHAAERSNKRFGQWMPEQWLEIFIGEMMVEPE